MTHSPPRGPFAAPFARPPTSRSPTARRSSPRWARERPCRRLPRRRRHALDAGGPSRRSARDFEEAGPSEARRPALDAADRRGRVARRALGLDRRRQRRHAAAHPSGRARRAAGGRRELDGDASIPARPSIASPIRCGQMGAGGAAATPACRRFVFEGGEASRDRVEPPIASAEVESCPLLRRPARRGDTTVVEPVPTRDHTERTLAPPAPVPRELRHPAGVLRAKHLARRAADLARREAPA